jgi:hypothetical protein
MFSGRLLAAAIPALIVLAGCAAQTEPATHVTATAADLNAIGQCTTQEGGSFWYEYRANGGSWTQTTPERYDCPNATPAVSLTPKHISGLTTGASYEFRICGDPDPAGGGAACFDADGELNGTDYDHFVTVRCDTTVAPSALQSAINAQPAGASICLSAGSGGGNVVANKQGQTIQAAVDANGNRAAAVLTGNLLVDATGVTLAQFTVRPTSASGSGGGVVKVQKANATLDHMDVDANGTGSSAVLAGGGSGAADGLRVSYSKLHGTDADTHNHAIYLHLATGGRLDHSWLYDVLGGWILHFNGDVNNYTVDHVVGDNASNRGFLTFFSDDGVNVPDGNTIQDSVFTDAPEFQCNNPGTGNTLVRLTINPYTDECSAYNVQSLSTTRPTYANEAGHQYQVQGRSDFQFTPGPQN